MADHHQQLPLASAPFGSICGSSRRIQELKATINTILSKKPSTILISGQPGTEKEHIAQGIHAGLFDTSDKLIIFNCLHLPTNLLSKRLTQFINTLLKKSENKQLTTTLLLHKINQLPESIQTRLLLLLTNIMDQFRQQDRSLLIIATNDKKTSADKTNLLQKDLDTFFCDFRITVPPLKDRQEDIPHLLNTIIRRYCSKYGRKKITFSANTMTILTQYPWQGNTRELKKLLRYLILNHEGSEITTKQLPVHFHHCPTQRQPWTNLQAEINWTTEAVDFRQLVDQFETELIVTAMRRSGGNKMGAARLLNLKRTTLIEKIKKKGISHLCKE